MKIIGLTGGIGSGKSTVAGFLNELGVTVLDLDETGHEVLQQKEIRDRLAGEFGGEILGADGEIDRTALGNRVFNDREALLKLNAIVHPAIDQIVEEKLGEYRRRGEKAVVLEAAAMLEARRDWQVNEVWVTAAPEGAVLKRLAERSDYSEAEARARILSQMTNEEKRKQADLVIDTDCSLEELKERVATEWRKLLARI